jgi:hypothetical protein
MRLYPTTAAFWKSTKYAGLKTLEKIEYDSLSGKTERGYQWVGALFSKGGELPTRFEPPRR